MVEHLNASGSYRAIWVDVQNAREQPGPIKAYAAVRYHLDAAVERDLPELGPPPDETVEPTSTFVLRYLRDLAARSSLPLVVVFDEVDGLVGEAMVSLLTQLRQGYIDRSKVPFPASVVLVGQRQVGDYTLFNVTAEALTLDAFTEAEVGELCEQHTAATGQRFEPEAVTRIYALGQGHPWLTNALAHQIVTWDLNDRSVPITAAHVEAAKETIILERNGGGRIEREYGLGRGALDLLILWKQERHAIEVKLRRDTITEERAVEQVVRYLDRLGLSEGWLVMFDLRAGPSWDERVFLREVERAGKRVRIVGC